MLTPGKHHWLRPGYYNTPSFRQICRDSWLNVLTETLCVIISIILWRFCPPLIPYNFPYFEGVETHPIGLKYSQPLREEYIDTIMMAAISFLVPSSIMLVMNLWVLRDYYNWDASFTGLSYALSTSTLFSCIIKVLIGGLRPNFYAICRPTTYLPEPTTTASVPPMPSYIQYSTVDQLCTNTDKLSLNEAQKSFPASHASSAFAGFVFLTLWLSAHYKTLGQSHHDTKRHNVAAETALHNPKGSFKTLSDQYFTAVSHWKLIVFSTPLWVAVVLSLSKLRDGWQHPVDVACGACIGGFFAVVAYKMVFWSVWDARDNHVPRRHVDSAGVGRE
ncbi:hypothetical protein COCC4DRAFT_43272 [Bipolaris maydis ATCC 48331]|uniref:Phosphatidic acid phosphatase type 2/haloperoxidase domain-containing protein n=3 Tax=Cochliobolus heterostrophus TaxID=5016 RepID=M2TBJ6_COCH5|nr:uncharacterized protein COCC4DRAFT_43272 [Bipolaris maydis ATCC 48331]EMD94910.1 hypothetical protein COCHEDRAFT_1210920 [Bipolaris maydis C5]KAH7555906.1 hypothetical protein BM1_06432 [Bipolaris maydis]ENI01799.1 hypothetical protein COCC4DRAFT_43272 [Bipolaris maydis ATCC 48331]KAJ5061957.1 phosphatidic acid phosphatase type 2/haloperoxidase [Bipolaris maydis]KAJ6214932.1 phosphatidic acid phosphatase type 2/haloperoxidase [Bipolaris maydis]